MTTKSCVRCGREITWRKKWARDWDNIKYCSKACRSKKLSEVDAQLEAMLHNLLAQHGRAEPQRALRLLGLGDEHREAARMAARRLVQQGVAQMWQGGRPVDVSTAKGAIELRALMTLR